MRWKAEVGEKGARAWVCDAKDMTRQFSVAVWVVDMLVADHNKLMDLEETTPPEALRSGETPRTNALTGTFYLRCDDCPQPEKCERMKSVHPDDARELERELVQAKADLAEVDEANTRLARDRQTAPSPLLRSQEKP